MTDPVRSRLALAKQIAAEAGRLAVSMRDARDADFAQQKGHQDFVTAADLAVEKLIRQGVQAAFPEDDILGEEEGASGEGRALWVVDPIDGTTNFMHGLPDWAVSIAFCLDGQPVCGAIYAPDYDLLLSGSRGGGVECNDQPVTVSGNQALTQSLALLGRSARADRGDYVQMLGRVFSCGLEYRRNGSAAYSLMSVALGRADAYYEAHLNAWDAMAGILLIEEAGGRVDYPPFDQMIAQGGPVYGSNGVLHDVIAQVTHPQADLAGGV